MNKQSGVYGISGVSSDFRDIEAAAKEGNKRAQLALDMFRYRVNQYIGSYAASMGGLDVIVFTAGVGENSASEREGICESLGFMGVELDKKKKNKIRGEIAEISTANSKVKVFIIPTNEELMIAKDTLALIK